MKKRSERALVETSLSNLQLLVSNAQAIFDLYRALAGLEQLVDHVRDCKDERAKRYSIILRQCRPLINSPAMQSVLIKLVADKEEAELVQVIDKTVCKRPGPGQSGPGTTTRMRWTHTDFYNRGKRQPQKRYRNGCSQPSHFARKCTKKRLNYVTGYPILESFRLRIGIKSEM